MQLGASWNDDFTGQDVLKLHCALLRYLGVVEHSGRRRVEEVENVPCFAPGMPWSLVSFTFEELLRVILLGAQGRLLRLEATILLEGKLSVLLELLALKAGLIA